MPYKNSTELFEFLTEMAKSYKKTVEMFNIKSIDWVGNIITTVVDDEEDGKTYEYVARFIVDEKHGYVYLYIYDDEHILLETDTYESVTNLKKMAVDFKLMQSKYNMN